MTALAILCSGQGSQGRGMFDLVAEAPEPREIFAAAAATLRSRDLRDVAAAGDKGDRHTDAIAQVLCCAQALAVWAASKPKLGDRRLLVAVYSVGEVAAWGVAGAVEPTAVFDIVAKRAALIGRLDPRCPRGSSRFAGSRHRRSSASPERPASTWPSSTRSTARSSAARGKNLDRAGEAARRTGAQRVCTPALRPIFRDRVTSPRRGSLQPRRLNHAHLRQPDDPREGDERHQRSRDRSLAEDRPGPRRPQAHPRTAPRARRLHRRGPAARRPRRAPRPQGAAWHRFRCGSTIPPKPAAGALPALIYMHGGGFVVGSLDQFETAMRRLCEVAGVQVYAVDYKLAPEYQWPVQIEEGEFVVRWLFDQRGRARRRPNPHRARRRLGRRQPDLHDLAQAPRRGRPAARAADAALSRGRHAVLDAGRRRERVGRLRRYRWRSACSCGACCRRAPITASPTSRPLNAPSHADSAAGAAGDLRLRHAARRRPRLRARSSPRPATTSPTYTTPTCRTASSR